MKNLKKEIKSLFESPKERALDISLYEKALNEFDSDTYIKGIYAKAVSLSKGNHQEVKARYLELRVEILRDELDVKKTVPKVRPKKKTTTPPVLVSKFKKCRKCDLDLDKKFDFCEACGHETEMVPLYIRGIRKAGFLGSTSGHYDILIYNEKFSIIKNNPTNSSLIFGLLLFVTLNLLGLVIAVILFSGKTEKSLSKIRSKWITKSNRLISSEYKKSIFLEVPLSEFNSKVTISRKRIVIIDNSKKFKFKKQYGTFDVLEEYIEKKYVL